ncbi:hypothetical protein [Aetokthonos hydrillicola]|uniref:hypothetical protein n=1 Tax=Aetokthonos hydrillicola TaxID=1550245 RepID=UPI001ABB5A7B|nr:hypothetical protein [Aetokthonos hydrillicola]MBO3461844.1 hypothetical protein [Aetokthonos hydrillicola CCALA 1050]MBW4588876.1 hypothetical protein [Aetokthonos hydrillicola CCALA 1050]
MKRNQNSGGASAVEGFPGIKHLAFRIKTRALVILEVRMNLDTTGHLVIEAKYEDLTRGFTQLVAEMVALDQWENATTVDQQPILIGVVSTGTIWQFGRLDRPHERQATVLLSLPQDLRKLFEHPQYLSHSSSIFYLKD